MQLGGYISLEQHQQLIRQYQQLSAVAAPFIQPTPSAAYPSFQLPNSKQLFEHQLISALTAQLSAAASKQYHYTNQPQQPSHTTTPTSTIVPSCACCRDLPASSSKPSSSATDPALHSPSAVLAFNTSCVKPENQHINNTQQQPAQLPNQSNQYPPSAESSAPVIQSAPSAPSPPSYSPHNMTQNGMNVGYNPYLPEPQLQSTAPKTNQPQPMGLMPNGWEPLVIVPSSRAVIPGVSTNAVGKNYRVSHKIGMGSFGEIFLGIDIRTNERIAIKVEQRTTKYPQLLDEYAVYRAVAKGVGVPNAIWCGSNTNVHIMVMDLLGDSLETLYNNCGRKFSLKTITMLAIQLLHRIEHHHNHHYLHRDIKPDNFLMGPPQSNNAHILYMVDMGLCKKYRDDANLCHIPYRENKKLIGTPRYASINTHMGIEQCRRDDLESIGYMLIYFFAGRLPWQGLKAKNKQEKYDKISQAKVNITTAELCKGAPLAFKTFLDYCRSLRFTQKPDYKYLRSLFYDLFRQNGWRDDCQYDWMLPKGVQPEPPRMNLTSTPQQQAQAYAQAQHQVVTGHQSNLLNYMYTGRTPPLPTPPPAPAAAGAIQSRAATPQQSFNGQSTSAQAYLTSTPQQQSQSALQTPRTTNTPTQQATQATATPATSTDQSQLVQELRRRITGLEGQVAEERSKQIEWKLQYEKTMVSVKAQNQENLSLRLKVQELELKLQQQQAQAAATIPLASASSLKRRRTAVNYGEADTNNTDDEENSAKKAKRRA